MGKITDELQKLNDAKEDMEKRGGITAQFLQQFEQQIAAKNNEMMQAMKNPSAQPVAKKGPSDKEIEEKLEKDTKAFEDHIEMRF